MIGKQIGAILGFIFTIVILWLIITFIMKLVRKCGKYNLITGKCVSCKSGYDKKDDKCVKSI